MEKKNQSVMEEIEQAVAQWEKSQQGQSTHVAFSRACKIRQAPAPHSQTTRL